MTPLTLADALAQLLVWCNHSQGKPIEIAPGVTGSFHSRQTYGESAVSAIEAALGTGLPSAYHAFMSALGESSLFVSSPTRDGLHFYHPQQVVEVSRQWIEATAPGSERFCFVGEHRCLGDLMGFCIDRPAPQNFDVFCHEYSMEEYAAVSDELRSWREFEAYIVEVVASCGRESL
jgi:hypothetical protein